MMCVCVSVCVCARCLKKGNLNLSEKIVSFMRGWLYIVLERV